MVLNLSKQCCFTTQNTAVVYHCFSDSEHFFCCCCSSRTTGRLFVLAGINRSIDDAHPARPLCGRPVAQQPSSPAGRPSPALLGPSSGPRSMQGQHSRRATLYIWKLSAGTPVNFKVTEGQFFFYCDLVSAEGGISPNQSDVRGRKIQGLC